MRVLFDQGVPAPLRQHLVEHDVATAYERGWSRLSNGALLTAAEGDQFDVFVTTDRNLSYQQNLADRTMAIVVLGSTRWPWIRAALESVVEAIDGSSAGAYIEVEIPPAE